MTRNLGEGGPFTRLETLETRVACMNAEIVGLQRRIKELEAERTEADAQWRAHFGDGPMTIEAG